MVFARQPAEGWRDNVSVCRKGTACCSTTSRTVALHKLREWKVDLKFHPLTKTSAAHLHNLSLRLFCCQVQSGEFPFTQRCVTMLHNPSPAHCRRPWRL